MECRAPARAGHRPNLHPVGVNVEQRDVERLRRCRLHRSFNAIREPDDDVSRFFQRILLATSFTFIRSAAARIGSALSRVTAAPRRPTLS